MILAGRVMNALARSIDFVVELSFALAHRWEPGRLYMFVYTAYLDESGTHGGSPVTVMGGMLARAQQRRTFQQGFDKAKKEHRFKIFHTKKFKKRDGDFKGWTNEQCLALLDDLSAITSTGFTDAVAISLSNRAYDEYYRITEIKTKARLDSKFGLCFRICLLYFVVEVAKHKYRGKFPPLHVIIEAGHRNVGDAERIFMEVKREFDNEGVDFIKTLTIAAKDQCDPLMMADFVAHSTFSMQSKSIKPGLPMPPSEEIPKGYTGITHFESTPEGIARIRERAISIARRSGGNRSKN